MKNAIEIKDLVKSYDNKFELGKISLTIPSGTIVGLIGENGAGKTTLIKLLLNIIKKDKGTIKIWNKDYLQEESNLKEEIGVVLDNMFFPEVLTPKDINSIMKDIYKKWDSNLYKNYLEKFKLPINKKINTFSKGMRKKLELATALSHNPKLLILDEPTSGLDPVIRKELLDIFLDFIQNEENTILISSHITTDLETIADKIVFIDQGRIVLDDNKDDLLEDYGILKCDIADFKTIEKQDIISYTKNKYYYEILIKNKEEKKKKYKEKTIDKITLENLMVLMIKGEK